MSFLPTFRTDISGGRLIDRGELLRSNDDGHHALVAADTAARVGEHVSASPWQHAIRASDATRFDAVALNPQPLPPRAGLAGAPAHIDDYCGTRIPLPLPPVPPAPLGGLLKSLAALVSDPSHAAQRGKSRLDAQLPAQRLAADGRPAPTRRQQMEAALLRQSSLAELQRQAHELSDDHGLRATMTGLFGVDPGQADAPPRKEPTPPHWMFTDPARPSQPAAAEAPERELASMNLQTAASQREQAEHVATSMRDRLDALLAAMAARV